MPESLFQRAFAGGELAPALGARADQAKYITGLRTCRNFIVQRSGGVANRPGLRFVNECKGGGDSGTFLMRYVGATPGDSFLIEAGNGYLRFYKNGGLMTLAGVAAWSGATPYLIGDIVLSGGVNYYCILAHTNHVPPNATYWYAMPSNILELPHPFGSGGFKWVQSGNVITLTSHNARPRELIFLADTVWVIQVIDTAPQIGPPTGLAGVAGVAGTQSFTYVVTAAAVDTLEESTPSAAFQINTAGPPTPAAPNTLSWTPPAGGPAAAQYYVYLDPTGNGTFGFIGTATGVVTFADPGNVPDFNLTPPLPRVLFTASGDFPATAAYYQQRRFFANTENNPDAVWASRIGLQSNFNVSSPLQDDDAITFRIAGNDNHPVRNILGLKTLEVLTDGGIWTIGAPKTALTPGNIPADQETYAGTDDLRPAVVGNAIIYVQARGALVRDVQFDQQVEGLAGRDLTIYAQHLVDGFSIDSLDYQQTPNSIVWACRSDGTLIGLTYIPEEEVWGWHRHDSGAAARFQSVCVVPEIGEDATYVIMRRTINGGFHRYIERLESRTISNFVNDAFFVDAGLTYTGAPVTAIGGLGHLIGQVVAVVADGVVIFDGDPTSFKAPEFTVDGAGNVPHVLAIAASVIHAGIPIRYADLELLDLDVQGNDIRDKKKRVGSVSLILEASVRTFRAGPDAANLTPVKLKPSEKNLQGVPFTGREELNVQATWNDYGRVFIRHTDPLPLTVLGALPNLIIGG
jgi:hypothetical protein